MMRSAAAQNQITLEAIEQCTGDLREFVKADLQRTLDRYTDGAAWRSETVFKEINTIRPIGIFPDDVDWDDDDAAEPEPIAYTSQPVINIIAHQYFTREE